MRVHAGGGVVQNEDARVHQEGAGNGQALTLAAAERNTALAHDRVIAFFELDDKFVGLGGAGASLNLLASGLRFAVSDVLHHAGAEQEGLLENHAHAAPKLIELKLAHVCSVHQYPAINRIVKTRDEVDQRGFA